MRFYFHVVLDDVLYQDAHGAECESIGRTLEDARAAIQELTTEEHLCFPEDAYVLMVCEELRVAILLPLADPWG